jgi:hypothetical protein
MIKQGQTAEKVGSEAHRNNVVFPKIPAWSGDFWEQNLQRLTKNPTREQLELLQRSAEDKFVKLVAVDLFVVLLGALLDRLPDTSALTPAQHELFYAELIFMCVNVLDESATGLGAAIKKTFNC